MLRVITTKHKLTGYGLQSGESEESLGLSNLHDASLQESVPEPDSPYQQEVSRRFEYSPSQSQRACSNVQSSPAQPSPVEVSIHLTPILHKRADYKLSTGMFD
eukprot:Gb_03079 [translate_table: standard]